LSFKVLRDNLYLNKIIDSEIVYAYTKLNNYKYNHKVIDAIFLLFCLPKNSNNPKGYEKVFTEAIFNKLAINNNLKYLTTPITIEGKQFELFDLLKVLIKHLRNYPANERFLFNHGEYYVFDDNKFKNWLKNRFVKNYYGEKVFKHYNIHPQLFKLHVNAKSTAYFKQNYKSNWFNMFMFSAAFTVPFGASFINQKYFHIPYTNNLFESFMNLKANSKSNKWHHLANIFGFTKITTYTELNPQSILKKELFNGFEHFDKLNINKDTFFNVAGFKLKITKSPTAIIKQLFNKQIKINPLAFQYFLYYAKANYIDYISLGYKKLLYKTNIAQHLGKLHIDKELAKTDKHYYEKEVIFEWLKYSKAMSFSGNFVFSKNFKISYKSAFLTRLSWPIDLTNYPEDRAWLYIDGEFGDEHYRKAKQVAFEINTMYLKKKAKLHDYLFNYFKQHLNFELLKPAWQSLKKKVLYVYQFKNSYIISLFKRDLLLVQTIEYSNKHSFWQAFNKLVWSITNIVFAQKLYTTLNIVPVKYNINY